MYILCQRYDWKLTLLDSEHNLKYSIIYLLFFSQTLKFQLFFLIKKMFIWDYIKYSSWNHWNVFFIINILRSESNHEKLIIKFELYKRLKNEKMSILENISHIYMKKGENTIILYFSLNNKMHLLYITCSFFLVKTNKLKYYKNSWFVVSLHLVEVTYSI